MKSAQEPTKWRRNIVLSLTAVTPTQRRSFLDLPPEAGAQGSAVAALPAFQQIAVTGFAKATGPAPTQLRVGAWNIQQCHFPGESGELLARQGFDITLFTELDQGMRRTGQIHAAAQLAKAQEHGHVFGVEFLELLSPPGLPPHHGATGDNRSGFHGNGLTAARAPLEVAGIDLGPEADWFVKPRRNQRRLGGRMAIAAAFALGQGECVLVSVHLESDTDQHGRARQFEALLAEIDGFAAGRPILIGGDFNTGAGTPDFDYESEPLFGAAAAHGYNWDDCNVRQPTSRVSRLPNAVQQSRAHYDWFFARGLVTENPSVIPATDEGGQALSDHEIIAVTIRLPEQS